MSKLCYPGLSFFVCKMEVIIFTPKQFCEAQINLSLIPENAQCIRMNDMKSLIFYYFGPGKFGNFIWFKLMCHHGVKCPISVLYTLPRHFHLHNPSYLLV